MNKIQWTFIVFLCLFSLLPSRILAQGCAQDACSNIPDDAANIQNRIDCLDKARQECRNQGDTLASQINYMNGQIRITTLKIAAARINIDKLGGEITALSDEILRLEDALNHRLTLLIKRIPESYKRSVSPQFGLLLLSSDFADFITRMKYLDKVQKEDASVIFQVKATQNNYNERKTAREDKKTQLERAKVELENQNQELGQQKQAKDALLTQTKGQEAIYLQLRQAALARLSSFASFTQGLGLLSGQTSCDGWGCYYSQRDGQWGNALINGQKSGCGIDNGPCSVLRVGCLITSVAMMASHLGHKDILPLDIAFSSSFNFSVGTADLMKGTISVKGVNINRTQIASKLSPDLVQNGPVIVGMYVPSGTHFVVIKSYSNGNYIMNDPVTENGHDISFTDHYLLGNIYEVDKVSI